MFTEYVSEDMALTFDIQNWTRWEMFTVCMSTNSCASDQTGEVLLYCSWGMCLFCKIYCTTSSTV